jgi:hypothetical protein
MGQFTPGGLAQILGAGLHQVPITILAFEGNTQVGNTASTVFSGVAYNFSTNDGTASVTFPETEITNIAQGTTVDKIEIRVSTTIIWEDDDLDISFTSLGSLTVDGEFSMTGGSLAERIKAAILRYGLAGRQGTLSLTGTNVQFSAPGFTFGTAGPQGVTQIGEVIVDITNATEQNPVTVDGVNVTVLFPDFGVTVIGNIAKSPALVYEGAGTTTVSGVRIQAANN